MYLNEICAFQCVWEEHNKLFRDGNGKIVFEWLIKSRMHTIPFAYPFHITKWLTKLPIEVYVCEWVSVCVCVREYSTYTIFLWAPFAFGYACAYIPPSLYTECDAYVFLSFGVLSFSAATYSSFSFFFPWCARFCLSISEQITHTHTFYFVQCGPKTYVLLSVLPYSVLCNGFNCTECMCTHA